MCQRYGYVRVFARQQLSDCFIHSSENLARSRGYEGTNARLHRVLQNAERGNPTKIAVLGGSGVFGILT